MNRVDGMVMQVAGGVRAVMGVMAGVVLLSGCQQARVERWVEVPCQPHGFFVAPKGYALADVARVCRVDEKLLRRHNSWLLTRQPFEQDTVVWLKPDPTLSPDDVLLEVAEMEPVTASGGMQAESLAPLGLKPARAVPVAPRSSVR